MGACVSELGSEEKWTSELFSRLLKNFYTMSPSDQREFLKLHTSYGFSKEEIGRKINLANLEDHFINDLSLKVYSIYETNKFNGGVAIQASRFNHSCVSNAENIWNENDSTIQFRASKKIKKGEEITINYLSEEHLMAKYHVRQNILKSAWEFVCSCELCQQESIENDDEIYNEFDKLKQEAKGIKVECGKYMTYPDSYLRLCYLYKEMYKL